MATASRPSRMKGPAVRSRSRRAPGLPWLPTASRLVSGLPIAAPYRAPAAGRVSLPADPPPQPGDVRRPVRLASAARAPRPCPGHGRLGVPAEPLLGPLAAGVVVDLDEPPAHERLDPQPPGPLAVVPVPAVPLPPAVDLGGVEPEGGRRV